VNLLDHSATELLRLLASRDVTAVELCHACLVQIEQHDAAIGAFIRVDRVGALQMAEAIDHRRAVGYPVGRLAGLPVAVKDILCARGGPTTCGSRMLEDFISPYDATVVERLKEADAILIGKTNLDEFAMGSSTETSAFGITRNPWNLACVPGGSSGGSAACVASRMVPLAIGTDTGGSIRQPAACCGVVGLKPTYGRVSRYGLVAFASSLDQAGPLARTVEDTALLLEVLAGHDSRDSTSACAEVPPYATTVRQPLDRLRLGIIREHFAEGLEREVEAAVREAMRVFESLGAECIDVSLPHSKYGIATYYIIAPSEASSNLARYDGAHYGYRTDQTAMMKELLDERRGALEAGMGLDGPLVRMYCRSRSEGFGAEVKRRIMLGTYALSAGYYDAYYLKASKVRRLIRQDYEAAFTQVDLVAGPVMPTAAFRIGERTGDPLAMYLGDLYTVTTNLAGVAGLSLPCGLTAEGLPIGLHLQARPFDEERLLRAAYMYQQATDWHTRSPSS
jgi:aspartyl-tRNA(Asn)/glutamyl-tRNA(Gln) amidotransferase subunit A